MSHDSTRETERFSLWLFVITIALSLASLLGLLWLIQPDVFRTQCDASIMSVILVILATHMLGAFVEFFFHRYVLHAPVVRPLAYFYRQHTLHHSLTRITMRRATGAVENRYPILEDEQHEASFFPWYSLLVFAGLATPVFIGAYRLWPHLPVFLGGWSGVALSMFLYELLHALEHRSLDWWGPRLSHPRYGRVWKVLYGFHLRHHADIRSNEAISGFFGIPLPDFVFGTYVRADSLYEDGTTGAREWFQSPRPIFFIRWLDSLAEKAVERYRAKRAEA